MSDSLKKQRFLPLWIYLLIAVQLFLITGVTIVGMQDITIMHPDQTGTSYLASLYITRNLVAVGGLVLAAFFFRSYVAFLVVYLSRIATEISDFSNSIWYGRDPELMASLPYMVIFMVFLPIIALAVVWPHATSEARKLRGDSTNRIQTGF